MEQADTLGAVLVERVKRSPQAVAYRQFDEHSNEWVSWTWEQFATEVSRWQQGLLNENLNKGDRVAVMLRNCREWAAFDMAAQGLGLIIVPLYVNDRPENCLWVLQDANVKLLLLGNDKQWTALTSTIEKELSGLQRILSMEPVPASASGLQPTLVDEWLPKDGDALRAEALSSDDMTAIVYTSGTTGRPKGVMLSHRNILFDVSGVLQILSAYPEDTFLSFLPLSHTLERTGGYYLPMVAGSTVAYARSVKQLGEDFEINRPTVIISVPRVFERVYAQIQEAISKEPAPIKAVFTKAIDAGWNHFLHQQGRGKWSPTDAIWAEADKLVGKKIKYKLGGRLRVAVAGGAPMSPEIAKFFIAIGIPILQGYGATETSPVVSVNPLENNIPSSVGIPLPGVEVRIGDDEEFQTRSPSVMMGYWNNPEATQKSIDADGWFHTGDQAQIKDGHVFITGRLKEIIVLSNGEKLPPGNLEMAIALDKLFSQVMVIGESRPYLSALVVLVPAEYAELAKSAGLSANLAEERQSERLEKILVERIAKQLSAFPGYAKIRRVGVMAEPWTIESGFMTPTLKLRRERILEAQKAEIARLYEGHE
jgi:long-chain acyl-CoA synthetase